MRTPLLLVLMLVLTTSAADAQQNAPLGGTGGSNQTAGKVVDVSLADSLILQRYRSAKNAPPSDVCAKMAAQVRALQGWCAQIPVIIRNHSNIKNPDFSIELRTPQAGPHLRFSVGNGNTSAFLDKVAIASNATMQVPLTAFVTEAGEHTAKVRIRSSDGNIDQERVLTVTAKRSWGWALGALVIGGLAGFLLVSFRGLAGERATAVAKSLAVAERYRIIAALARGTRLLPSNQRRLLDNEIEAELANARAGRPLDDKLEMRIKALKEWTRLAIRATALQADALKPLEAQFHSLLHDIRLSDAAPDLSALESSVNAALERQRSTGGFEAAVAERAADASDTAVNTAPTGLAPFIYNVRDLRQFDRRRFFVDLGIASVGFLLFATAAIIALYVKDAGWGTVEDLLNAVLVGAVAFLGAGQIARIKEFARN